MRLRMISMIHVSVITKLALSIRTYNDIFVNIAGNAAMASKTFSRIRNCGEYSSQMKVFSIVARTTRLSVIAVKNCERQRSENFLSDESG